MEHISQERCSFTHITRKSFSSYDCAVDLLLGTTLPRGRIYSPSVAEQGAIEEYVEEVLWQGYIEPCIIIASVGILFIEKKGGGLWPCIYYRGLNFIKVKYPYPLPFTPSALEHLLSAIIFPKLDLRSAYNLIRIREGDEWKPSSVHLRIRIVKMDEKISRYNISEVWSAFIMGSISMQKLVNE